MDWDNFYMVASLGLLIGFIVVAILTIVIQKRFQEKNQQYALKQSSTQKTGAEVARMILEKNNITNVRVVAGQEGQDHFNPQTNTVSLSPSVYNSSSVSAMAIAAHECGHAMQHAKGEMMVSVRTSMAPAVAITTQIGSTMFQIGFLMWIFGGAVFGWFTLAGLIVYGAMGIFQLITLPVEFGASRKAKKELAELNLMVTDNDKIGTKGVLNAAAMTYVIAFLSTAILLAIFLLRFIAMTRN